MLAACLTSAGLVLGDQGYPHPAARARTTGDGLLRMGHDGIDVEPALKRNAGIVTGLGAPDAEGRIYSFRAARLPPAPGYALDELRGWRLTVLAGERFSSVFEVQSNTDSEITVNARDGPLNGLAVKDVFVLELIAVDRSRREERAGKAPGI